MKGELRVKMKPALLLGTTIGAVIIPASLLAQETVVYKYDPLGRLVESTVTGGTSNGQSTGLAYDPAGNRCIYAVSGVGGTAPSPPPTSCSGSPPPPPPPPPPPSGNQPPVAVADSGGMTKCVATTFAVLANDYDPDGNTPLSLVGVSGGGTRGTPSISGTSVLFTPNEITGTANVSYVVQDSLGAQATGSLTITITSGTCGNN